MLSGAIAAKTNGPFFPLKSVKLSVLPTNKQISIWIFPQSLAILFPSVEFLNKLLQTVRPLTRFNVFGEAILGGLKITMLFGYQCRHLVSILDSLRLMVI